MSKEENEFYNKVSKYVSDIGTAYTLIGEEHQLAKSLVQQGKIFYSIDYDHVMALK